MELLDQRSQAVESPGHPFGNVSLAVEMSSPVMPPARSQKRKRQDGDEQELRRSNQSTRSVTTDGKHAWSPIHSLDPKDLGAFQTSFPPKPSEVSLLDTTFDDDVLPELSLYHSTSSPDTDETYSLDGVGPYGNISPTRLLEELESNTGKAQNLDDDALFSQYLRSRSPSYFSAKGIGGNDNDGGIYLQTVTPGTICLSTEEDLHAVDSIDQNTAKPKSIPVNTSKPRIILRICQPKPPPKPKLLLRLSQPKRALA